MFSGNRSHASHQSRIGTAVPGLAPAVPPSLRRIAVVRARQAAIPILPLPDSPPLPPCSISETSGRRFDCRAHPQHGSNQRRQPPRHVRKPTAAAAVHSAARCPLPDPARAGTPGPQAPRRSARRFQSSPAVCSPLPSAHGRPTIWRSPGICCTGCTLLARVAADQVPLRPSRSEPRARKRRQKDYQFLNRPRHLMCVSDSRRLR